MEAYSILKWWWSYDTSLVDKEVHTKLTAKSCKIIHMLATKMSQLGTRAGMPVGARLDITFPADLLPNAQYPEIATDKYVNATIA